MLDMPLDVVHGFIAPNKDSQLHSLGRTQARNTAYSESKAASLGKARNVGGTFHIRATQSHCAKCYPGSKGQRLSALLSCPNSLMPCHVSTVMQSSIRASRAVLRCLHHFKLGQAPQKTMRRKRDQQTKEQGPKSTTQKSRESRERNQTNTRTSTKKQRKAPATARTEEQAHGARPTTEAGRATTQGEGGAEDRRETQGKRQQRAWPRPGDQEYKEDEKGEAGQRQQGSG